MKKKKKINFSSIILSITFIVCAVLLIVNNTNDTGIKMDPKASDIVGSKGTRDFVAIFTKLDGWHSRYQPDENGVVLAGNEDENRFSEITDKFIDYRESCDKIKDEAEAEYVNEYNETLFEFYDENVADIANALFSEENTVSFTQAEWEELGKNIDALIADYVIEE